MKTFVFENNVFVSFNYKWHTISIVFRSLEYWMENKNLNSILFWRIGLFVPTIMTWFITWQSMYNAVLSMNGSHLIEILQILILQYFFWLLFHFSAQLNFSIEEQRSRPQYIFLYWCSNFSCVHDVFKKSVREK